MGLSKRELDLSSMNVESHDRAMLWQMKGGMRSGSTTSETQSPSLNKGIGILY